MEFNTVNTEKNMQKKANSLAKSIMINMSYAFTAQGISLILSLLFILVVSKKLGVEQFGYWQLFTFYSSYLGFFYLGLNDGLYLRIGGKEYNELNHSVIATQSRIFFFLHTVLAALVSIAIFLFVGDPDRRFVLLCTALFLPILNIKGFYGLVFQAVNRTKIYSLSIILDKIIIVVAVIVMAFLGIKNYIPYVIIYIIAAIAASIYCFIIGKDIFFARKSSFAEASTEAKKNISVGIKLMFSCIASMLIIGSSRLVIDSAWGIETFSKVSLALNITNLFLVFIQQISLVLFPALRRLGDETKEKFYCIVQDILNIILPGMLLFYVPICFLLNLWLPQYSESLKYLGYMLPLCIFDGKMQLLGNTYYKVLRMEKQLFYFNVATLGLNILFALFFGFVLKSLIGIVVSTVISVAFRSIISEVYLSKIYKTQKIVGLIQICALSLIFAVGNYLFSEIISFIVFASSYSIYLLLNIKTVKNAFFNIGIITKKNTNK